MTACLVRERWMADLFVSGAIVTALEDAATAQMMDSTGDWENTCTVLCRTAGQT